MEAKEPVTPPRKRVKPTKTVDQKFRKEYHEKFSFITRSTQSDSHAFCTICRVNFSVSHGGMYDVKKHIATDSHTSKNRALEQNHTISSMFVSSSFADSVTNAELLFTNFLVEHNIPLSASDHAGPLFKSMFPDSPIASKVSFFINKLQP